MPPVLIIKTGQTIDSIAKRLGDFEDWISQGLELPKQQVSTVHVFQGQSLPEPEFLAGVVITGSPAMVTDAEEWIATSVQFIKEAVAREVPVLGICFGHQLLAHALDGRVDYHPQGREIGTTSVTLSMAAESDPLFGGLPLEFPVHTTHMQSVMGLPERAVILAGNGFDPHHGVRFADNAWGVQFHPEFDADIMTQYIQARADDIGKEGQDVAQLLSRVRSAPEAWSLLKRFAGLCSDTAVGKQS